MEKRIVAWYPCMLLFSFVALLLVCSAATMPFSGTESTEDGSDWPPQGGDISEPFCYDFTPGELAEVHEYFKTRLNLTLPRKISRSMGLKEEIHNGFYRAMEDRYYLGIMFFFHYLGQQTQRNNTQTTLHMQKYL